MCSTEANLEVVEVLMFLAGSYSEIWGCLMFVLQCKHAEDDSSNPGNLIESS